MNTVRTMKDGELLHATKSLAQREREITTQVLRHLAEIERRKLYCEVERETGELAGRGAHGRLKYGSLFEYAVHELKYSEAAAARRIQAMRLLKEMPEIEPKIESGVLSLSNIAKAQTFFREIRRAEPARVVAREEKSALLEQLEQKTTREGEKILLAITPSHMIPKEKVRQVTPTHIEMRIVVDAQLQASLEEVRSLLGPRGTGLSIAELIHEMSLLSVEKLKEKKFGKRRVQAEANSGAGVAPATELQTSAEPKRYPHLKRRPVPPAEAHPSHSRYIPQAVKHAVWRRAHGKCVACSSQRNLQLDHIQPLALGGTSTADNLQLLCAACNVRRGVKTFGTAAMRRP